MDLPLSDPAEDLRIQTIVKAVLRVISESAEPAILFSTVIDRFRNEEMPERISTRRSYESMLCKWIGPRWANTPISLIKTADIELWLSKMDCSARTRQHRKGLLHVMFNAAIRWELITRNPVTLARVKGGSKRLRRPMLITLDELRSVISHLDQPWRQMVMLAACLGLRASEIVALKWKDFDFEAKTLIIERGAVSGRVAGAKTESSQDILPLHEDLAEEMLRYSGNALVSSDGWVFPSPVTGRPYHQDTIRKRRLNEAGKAIGLPRLLGWHTFRHSYRRWLDEAGTPVGIIKELMRHADIATTMNVYGVGTLTPAKRQAHVAVVDSILKGERKAC